jgi:CheY-like chemotaxis protein
MKPSPARPLRILLADTCPDSAGKLAEVLRGLGHRVELALTVEDALLQVSQASPDVVLLDMALPGLDTNLLRRLFARPGMESALRIAVTSGQGPVLDSPGPASWHLLLSKPLNPLLLEHLLRAKQRVL